jgi:glycosyltransferase involved in cell wall biosynthesis
MLEKLMPAVSIVVPLFNEEESFSSLIKRLNTLLEQVDFSVEVVLVDDGSTDNTSKLMQVLSLSDSRFQSIFLSRNFGHQYALSAGLEACRCTEAVFVIDGDLQDPPELLIKFYNCLKQGYDVVYAIRKKRKEGILKKILYSSYYRLMKSISYINIPIDSGDFSLISRKVIDVLNSMPEESRYIRGMRSWVGFKQIGLEYEREYRIAGNSKYSLSKLLSLAYKGIFNFSTIPIKFISVLGFFSILISSFYLAYTFYRRLVYNDVPEGFTTLIFSIVLFSGVQLLAIGIIGEYVLRIFFQVKQRPLYIVKNKIFDKEFFNE